MKVRWKDETIWKENAHEKKTLIQKMQKKDEKLLIIEVSK